ncbi:threonine/serine ThrE exporter family protein [Anaerotignum sp.]
MDKDTKLINLALDAGEIMIRNGAETFRVQDTMQRILATSGQEKVEAIAMVTVLLATLPREEKGPLSMMRAIHSRSVNFRKVCEVNDMSRAFVSGKIDIDEALQQLDEISHEKEYSFPVRILFYGLIAGCFSFMSSRSALDGFIAQLIGMLLCILNEWLNNKKVPYFFAPFLGGVLSAYCACWMHPVFPGSHIDTIVIGALMPLLPGVTFAKSMRDLMEGNIISGYTKAVEALVIAASLAGGVGLTLSYFL